MRRVHTYIVVGLTVGSFALSVATVVAQDEADQQDPATTTYVTGTFSDPAQTIVGADRSAGGGLVEHRDYQWVDITVETDDPRLNGTMSVAANGNERYLSGTVGVGPLTDIQAFGVRITNDGGGWTGQGTAFIHVDGSTATTDLDTIILTGEGAYEGLAAYLLVDHTVTPRTVEGTVFAGEMTPYPEAPEAS